MATPLPGTLAPDFTAATDEGEICLSALRGGPVVLYFYPKDATSACTLEAREFAGLHERFVAAGVRVLGVSKDPVRSHARFRSKEGLPFALVSDEGGICEAYGSWRRKKLYGREYDGIARITVLIDAEGRVARVWDPVRARGHAAEVLAHVEGG
jgi:thioredoxin-dependent peroxiredoxin